MKEAQEALDKLKAEAAPEDKAKKEKDDIESKKKALEQKKKEIAELEKAVEGDKKPASGCDKKEEKKEEKKCTLDDDGKEVEKLADALVAEVLAGKDKPQCKLAAGLSKKISKVNPKAKEEDQEKVEQGIAKIVVEANSSDCKKPQDSDDFKKARDTLKKTLEAFMASKKDK